ncbi:hypothetical protein EJ05DRAFT_532751 [Pseudovirgaria hyperparasitica]|uniref:Fumarylacetoacetase-like C-terminal domain-containing protein n=1 Tax=Pseudovirgaria hyperparasitica TaxID=470096 RepID=A0A6A6VZ04_9PEZI|nr:uncharacterized protein EJ05DRAFT_532751 [Pseudovirgaria hyperparasitica]KAF2755465.1 hypothetical protein EJ05DRAFT_532751 [Pseudovirgaria hyperparasitica]
MPAWTRLIRFVDEDDIERYGEPIVNSGDEVIPLYEAGRLEATVLSGTTFSESGLTPEKGVTKFVKELLSPLTPKDVPIVRCVGLNYMKHIKEGGRTAPPYPSIFIKGSPSIAQWNETIPIPPVAHTDSTDYEGELCFVVGRTAKDIPREDALSYIAGYLVGNDISNRAWQRDPAYAGSVPQWGFSKGFDKYAPLGPVIVSPSILKSADDLRLQTFVNGELRQDTGTDDMLFDVTTILSFISQGTTIEAGTVVMTGTPSGVGFGFKPEPKYLTHEDEVEVRITGLGSVRNKIRFEVYGFFFV